MGICEEQRLQKDLLIEEWKKNVDLYIDQDKRGFERIKMFLAIHAGLLVFFSFMWERKYNFLSIVAGCFIAVMGLFLTLITQRMSRRAHSYIHLRRVQAMLIEKKLKKLIAPNSNWETDSGIITTFTRERVVFNGDPLNQEDFGGQVEEWQPLIDEHKLLGEHTYASLIPSRKWKKSKGHLEWLMCVYGFLYILWTALGVLISSAKIWDC